MCDEWVLLMKVQVLYGQQAHHTHKECLSISLDSYHYPSLHPPFGSDPLYRSWPITQSHPCSLHLSLSLFGISTAFTLNTHTLLYTLGDTFRDAGLSLTLTSHLVLLFSPTLHTACVLCLRFALLYSLPHFLFYSLPPYTLPSSRTYALFCAILWDK